MESLELILKHLVNTVTIVLEFSAVLCVAAGFVSAMFLLMISKQIQFSPLHNRLRFKFGGWLALVLEFQLASDILKTAIAPTYVQLKQLGAITIIRTFLNYFLNKELKESPEMIKQNFEKSTIGAVS